MTHIDISVPKKSHSYSLFSYSSPFSIYSIPLILLSSFMHLLIHIILTTNSLHGPDPLFSILFTPPLSPPSFIIHLSSLFFSYTPLFYTCFCLLLFSLSVIFTSYLLFHCFLFPFFLYFSFLLFCSLIFSFLSLFFTLSLSQHPTPVVSSILSFLSVSMLLFSSAFLFFYPSSYFFFHAFFLLLPHSFTHTLLLPLFSYYAPPP